MFRSALTLGLFALLATAWAQDATKEKKGDEKISKEERPTITKEKTDDKGQREFEMGETGTDFTAKTAKGKKLTIGLGAMIELQADGETLVGGDNAIRKLQAGSEKRKDMTIKYSGQTKEGKLDADKIDKGKKIERKNKMTTEAPANPPDPPRKRRQTSDKKVEDAKDQTIEVTEVDMQEQDLTIEFAEDQNTFSLTIAMIVPDEELDIKVGEETLNVQPTDLKLQIEIKDYTFCGNGGRTCEDKDGQETVGEFLKICFFCKGSANETDDPSEETNSVDDTRKFRCSEGSVKFSEMYINEDAGVIKQISSDLVQEEKVTLGEEEKDLICVAFAREDGETDLNASYDPTASADDDDEDDNEEESGAGHVTFGVASLALAAILNQLL